MKKYRKEWDESYERNENHILYPHDEVVKFLNRFVRKKLGDNVFSDILTKDDFARPSIRGLDYGCGIGRMTMLLHEFNIEAYGVDISKKSIQKAKKLFPKIKSNYLLSDGNTIPFENDYFDIAICESVIDSMHFSVAKEVIKELERVTNHYVYISFISGDNSNSYREYCGEEIISALHEKGTVQSYYNWSKILELIEPLSFEIVWASLITEESLIDQNKDGRYHVVLKKTNIINTKTEIKNQ